ncbi:MAG TPA: cell wall hydrolase [Devosiaceae bacterium]|nr:cell wall hydrolase [Devosiaceae bacterium]
MDIAGRAAARAVALGATAFFVFGSGLTPSFAQNLQVAEVAPQTNTAPVLSEPLSANAQAQSSELTPAVLAAYVARQQARKGFDILPAAPQPQLTSAMVSAYAEAHYTSNAALDAINGAAAPGPAGLDIASVDLDQLASESASSSVTEQMLESYAHHGFEPTARRIAQANNERGCLSQAIYNEARGESNDGQWAVANVIINRAMSKRFPSTMCGVIYQNADQGLYRCQFTFACDGRRQKATERRAWVKANEIAAAAYSDFQHGKRPGVVPGSALYYHTTSVSPDWGFKRVAQIGAHVFYSPM